MVVRPAKIEDLGAIANIHFDVYKKAEANLRVNDIEEAIEEDQIRDINKRWTYVSENNGKILGFGMLSEFARDYNKIKEVNDRAYDTWALEITRLIVDRKFQKGIIGTRIVQKLAEITETVDTPIIYNQCTTENITTQRFSQRAGYFPSALYLHCVPNYYNGLDDTPFTAVIYSKPTDVVKSSKVLTPHLFVDESNVDIVKEIINISGMGHLEVESLKVKPMNELNLKYENRNDLFGSNKFMDRAMVSLTMNSTGRMAYLKDKGFFPTGIYPFMDGKDGKGGVKYHHFLLMQRLSKNTELDYNSLNINREDTRLVRLNDMVVDGYKESLKIMK